MVGVWNDEKSILIVCCWMNMSSLHWSIAVNVTMHGLGVYLCSEHRLERGARGLRNVSSSLFLAQFEVCSS